MEAGLFYEVLQNERRLLKSKREALREMESQLHTLREELNPLVKNADGVAGDASKYTSRTRVDFRFSLYFENYPERLREVAEHSCWDVELREVDDSEHPKYDYAVEAAVTLSA